VSKRPDWVKAALVADIYSVSGYVSTDFADYIPYWKHNGFWVFDSPEIIRAAAREHSIELEGTSLFYYEVYEEEFDGTRWVPFGAGAVAQDQRNPALLEAALVHTERGRGRSSAALGRAPEAPTGCDGHVRCRRSARPHAALWPTYTNRHAGLLGQIRFVEKSARTSHPAEEGTNHASEARKC
jgi:hypothetical protein